MREVPMPSDGIKRQIQSKTKRSIVSNGFSNYEIESRLLFTDPKGGGPLLTVDYGAEGVPHLTQGAT